MVIVDALQVLACDVMVEITFIAFGREPACGFAGAGAAGIEVAGVVAA